MKSSKDESRINAARILSIILESYPEEEFNKEIKEMLADVKNKVKNYSLKTINPFNILLLIDIWLIFLFIIRFLCFVVQQTL